MQEEEAEIELYKKYLIDLSRFHEWNYLQDENIP